MAAAKMSNIGEALSSVIKSLSKENYEQSFARYRFLFEVAQTYSQIPSDFIFDTLWKQIRDRGLPSHDGERFFYPASPLILRFANDAESDSILASHSAGLRSRLCTSILREFFDHWSGVLYLGHRPSRGHLLDANLIAHAANLGYIEETTIRNHILQFLTVTPYPLKGLGRELTLCVLFEIAGATFTAYTDSSVVDQCFKLLKGCNFTYMYSQQIKVGGLYKEDLVGAKTIYRRR